MKPTKFCTCGHPDYHHKQGHCDYPGFAECGCEGFREQEE